MPRSARLRRWTRICLPPLLSLAAALALLGAVELGLRWSRGAPPRLELSDNFDYAHLDILKPYFQKSPLLFGRELLTPQRKLSKARSFVMPKPEGLLRVFIVGGSVADPFTSEGTTRLQEFLASAFPGRRSEVLACGMGGYDSRRDALVLSEILGYSPDLVILLTGNNEFYNAEAPYPRLYLIGHHLSVFWIYRELERRIGIRDRANFDGPPTETINPAFEKNLRTMASMAHARKVPLVVLTLGANLRDSPPATVQPMFEEPLYFEAWTSWERGDLRLAAKRFQAFLAAYPRDAFGHFYLAKTLDRLGTLREARAHYIAAADEDLPGERTSPARNEIIRRAARDAGAAVADVEKAFRSISPQGLPGNELFRDPCHWHHELYPLVSLAVLRSVYEHDREFREDWLAPPSRWRWAWASGLEARLRAPRFDPEKRRNYFEDTLYSGLGGAVVVRKDQVWDHAVTLLQRDLQDDPARFRRLTASKEALAPLYEKPWFRAMRQQIDQDWPAVLVHVGEAYRREGRPREALARFSQALALLPGYYQARLRRAIALGSLGRRSEALAGFDSLIREFPERRELPLWRARFGGLTGSRR
ncbi:MAG: tetratricopeptide repeat protein [Elusimicrobia bacterium]|nr:tetratricopeptide repeat protein [Elusimicrobiota bacterium]